MKAEKATEPFDVDTCSALSSVTKFVLLPWKLYVHTFAKLRPIHFVNSSLFCKRSSFIGTMYRVRPKHSFMKVFVI